MHVALPDDNSDIETCKCDGDDIPATASASVTSSRWPRRRLSLATTLVAGLALVAIVALVELGVPPRGMAMAGTSSVGGAWNSTFGIRAQGRIANTVLLDAAPPSDDCTTHKSNYPLSTLCPATADTDAYVPAYSKGQCICDQDCEAPHPSLCTPCGHSKTGGACYIATVWHCCPSKTLLDHCSDYKSDCHSTRCCQDSDRRCYEKDEKWASCLAECPLHTSWACTILDPRGF